MHHACFCCCLPANVLGKALWSDGVFAKGAQFSQHFELNGFGNYVLDRGRVISAVHEAIEEQLTTQPNRSTSVYLYGCRGMGKTSILHVLARDLESKDWEVYMYKTATAIPRDAGEAYLAYAEANPSKRIAVLVDEVNADPNHSIFVDLLKDAPPNVLVVGAAVPKQTSSGATIMFRDQLRSDALVLRKDDTDVLALIEFWKKHKVVVKNDVTDKMVRYVSCYLLKYCGGHPCPVLIFMEHFFARTTRKQAKEFLSSKRAFNKHFHSAEFATSECSKEVRSRCFYHLRDDKEAKMAFARVLGGVSKDGDITTLTRLGWWLEETNTILSTLLMNECMLRAIEKAKPEDAVVLGGGDSQQQNLEVMIITGLKKMTSGQLNGFDEENPILPIEDALSFSWGSYVMALVANVHVEFQRRSGKRGWVDFYLNGRVDTALEVIRNATQTANVNSKRGSADIDEHLERFTSHKKKYNFQHFALLNFAMEGKEVVLPRDMTHHDKVYTYDHATNALYRGSEIIRPNVVDMVKSIPKAPTTVQRSDYSTTVQSLASSSVNISSAAIQEEEEEEQEEVQITGRKRTVAFISGERVLCFTFPHITSHCVLLHLLPHIASYLLRCMTSPTVVTLHCIASHTISDVTLRCIISHYSDR